MQNLPSTRKEAKSLGLKFYFTGKPCKNGHIDKRSVASCNCLSCAKDWLAQNQDAVRESRKRSYQKNAERNRIASREYHRANRERILGEMRERNKRYYKKNAEKIKAQVLAYQKENAAERTKYKNEWARKKAAQDPTFKMYLSARRILQRALGVAGQKKYKRTTDYLPYTTEDLVLHLESQFQEGMSWDNYGEWHIDHIKPIKAFIDEGVTDPAIINALDNLQPLWASENMSKGAKYDD